MQKKLSPQQICSLAAGALFAVLSVVWLVRIFRVLVPMLELVGLIPEMFNGIQYFFLMFAAPLLAAIAMCLRKPALARAAFIAVAASLLINLVNGAINRSIAALGYPASLALIAGYVLMAFAARAPRGRPNLVFSFLPAALVLLGRALYLVPFTNLDLGYLLSYLDEIAALALAGFAFTETAARPYAAPGGFAPPPQRQAPGAQGFTPYPGAQGFRPVPPQPPAQGCGPIPPQAPAGNPGPSGAPVQPPRAYAPVQTAARPAPAAQGFRPAPPERPQPQAGRPPRPAEPARPKAQEPAGFPPARPVPPEPAAPAPRRPQPAAPRAPKAPAGRAPAHAVPPRPQAAPPAAGSPLAGLSEEVLTELRAYKELYDIGIVTRAELESKARELMGK